MIIEQEQKFKEVLSKIEGEINEQFFFGSLNKTSFENVMIWGPKGGISILVENGPLGCYL